MWVLGQVQTLGSEEIFTCLSRLSARWPAGVIACAGMIPPVIPDDAGGYIDSITSLDDDNALFKGP